MSKLGMSANKINKSLYVVIASPCSGHGFKHSAAIGEVLADLSTNQKPKIDISKFAFMAMEKRLAQF